MPRTLQGLIDALERVRRDGGLPLDTPVVMHDDDLAGDGEYIALDELFAALSDDSPKPEYVFTYEVTVRRNIAIRATNQLDAYTRLVEIARGEFGTTVTSMDLSEVTLNGKGVGEWPTA